MATTFCVGGWELALTTGVVLLIIILISLVS
jgi:hypothetical protein